MSKVHQVPFSRSTPCEVQPPLLDQIPLGRSIIFEQSAHTPFAGYVESCGHEERRGAYKLDGRRRRRPLAIFQYTLAGCGRLQSGGKIYHLTPGRAMVLVLPHPHKYWLPAEEESWRFLFVSMSGGHIIGIWRWLMRKAGPVVELPADAEPIVVACEICRRAQSGAFDDDYISADFAHRLTFSLCEALLPGTRPLQEPGPLTAAKDFINQNFHRPISIPDVAVAAGVSANALTHLFHVHENATPRAFLEKRRLERACFLLSTTEQPVLEVAKESGFSSGNYFAKVFRRLVGTSPGQYREKIS
jgi:AraC-like DNA-binding protein